MAKPQKRLTAKHRDYDRHRRVFPRVDCTPDRSRSCLTYKKGLSHYEIVPFLILSYHYPTICPEAVTLATRVPVASVTEISQ